VPGVGAVTGPGPLYPVYGNREVVRISDAKIEGGWAYVKTLWVARRSVYDGPAIVRGQEIDGSAQIRFGNGSNPADELILSGGDQEQPDAPGWNQWPTYARMKPGRYGCFAYQIDGLDFSEVVVFQVGP
jgi:hypothetical protein